MHEHPIKPEMNPCIHELKYCRKCDIVFCEKCMSEWVKKPVIDVMDTYKKWEQQKLPRPYDNPHCWPITTKREEVFK